MLVSIFYMKIPAHMELERSRMSASASGLNLGHERRTAIDSNQRTVAVSPTHRDIVSI